MTVLVQQRTDHDCSICCLSMLTGRPYEEVIDVVGDTFDPERGMRFEHKALERLGFIHEFESGKLAPTSTMSSMHRPFMLTPEFFLGFAWGRRALLSVPSLNFEGGMHMVFCAAGKVFDPSTKRRYERFNDLRPDGIVLFSEVPLKASMQQNQIRHMVDRFLGWKLPESFNPDGGISFQRMFNEHTPWPTKAEPVGTNLFDAEQAEAMIRHMLAGLPAADATPSGETTNAA